MKIKNYLSVISLLIICNNLKAQSANTSLSNLISPTKVNVSLLPSKDSSINLGSNTKNWKNIYLKGKVYFGNTVGMYTNAYDDFFAGPNAGNNFSSPNNGGRNTGIGKNALYYGGYSNTAVGWNSLAIDSTGAYNTAIGALSLLNNESGNENTATGNGALYKLINGSDNAAVGAFALQANFSGDDNVAVGAYALYNAYNSESNTATGYQSLYSSTTGFNNTAIGYESLHKCTGGFQNTSVGYKAGFNVTSGDNNTFIGTNSNCGSTGALENATALGYGATVTSDNHIRIGNTSVTSIGGQVGWSTFSDGRIKNNIQQNVPGLAFINLLKPVTYHFDIKKQQDILGRKDSAAYNSKYYVEKIQFSGFVAQDVEVAAKKIGYDFSGVDIPESDKELYSLRYSDFVVPLVKAVQELSRMNDSKDSIINNLETRLARIESLINTQQLTVNGQQSTVSISSVSLQQNVPNPFANTTTINYTLLQQFTSARIIITDKNGNTLKQINLSNNKGSINVDASTLSSGAYQYSLYVDGRLIDTKQMQSLK